MPTTTATTAAPEKFQKLPGRAAAFRFRKHGLISLYLADSYLLQIEIIAYREVYLKFAYKDIQAFEICRTSRGLVYNWILGVLSVLFSVCALLAKDVVETLVVLAAFAGFVAFLLVINLVRGATCKTIVQTATGKQPLRSLSRIKTAQRVVAMVAERIEAVQGPLDPGAAAQQMEDFLLRRAVQQRQRVQPVVAAAPTAEPVAAATPVPGEPM